MSEMKKAVISLLVVLTIGALGLVGCGSQEPIVGTWKSYSGNLSQYNADGTYTYTNDRFTELGFLEGTWERNENLPKTVEADGKTWEVYLTIDAAREIEGEGDSGNKYEYSDGHTDYYALVSGDDMAITIGAGSIERIAETGELDDISTRYGSKRQE